MKGKDKKWLLIDSRFICLNPDNQTMQSNLAQKGAKVLMVFQTTLVSLLEFIQSHYSSIKFNTFHFFFPLSQKYQFKFHGISKLNLIF